MNKGSTTRNLKSKTNIIEVDELEDFNYKYMKRMLKIIFLILIVIIILILIISLIYILLIKEKKQSKKYNMHFYNNKKLLNNEIINEKNTTILLDTDIVENIKSENIETNRATIENDIIQCQTGFYLTINNKGYQMCKKCSLDNCENCYEDGDIDICRFCISPFVPIYDENNIIKKCEKSCLIGEDNCLLCNEKNNNCSECKNGYQLKNGRCILNETYSFKAVYKTSQKNEMIELISNNYTKEIIEMKIEDKIISPNNQYLFPEIGEHTIYYLINNDITSLSQMFFKYYLYNFHTFN